MKLELKRISMPNANEENGYVTYENQLQPRRRFGNNELEELFDSHEDEIMKIVEQGISDYVNDDNLCCDDDDPNFFPRRCELTGEWYVGEIYFLEKSNLIVMTHFLGARYLKSRNEDKGDYLGLEVFLYYDEDSKKFDWDGDINQSVI